jgi:hypothetical protein
VADDFTDHALAFIEKNKSRPFLCYVPFNTPHSPFCVPEAYWSRFKDKPISMRGQDGDREDLPVTRCTLAMVENLDWNVGRVLRKLDELKLSDNTIVIYFSDNGPNSWRWNGGMKGRKGSVDEGGLRSTLLVRWPGKIAPGADLKPIAGAVDLLPTLVSLAGIARAGDRPLDGRDLSPLLLGTAGNSPDRTIFSHQNGQVSARTQRWRLDKDGALFDMEADPAQSRNVAAAEPETAARLAKAVADWRRDVFGPAGKAAPDDRPFPVGHREFPVTMLPARDGVPRGGVKRSSSAPNCSYFVNWRTTADSIAWDVEVATAGDYAVTVDYTCPPADAGSRIELSFGEARLAGKVEPGWDPPLYSNQDTLPRPPAESRMKEFRPLALGTIRLPKGRGPLVLRALEIPGAGVMDVRRITLTLLP